MKRFVTAALAALTFAAPLAIPSQAAAQDRNRHGHDDRHDRRDDRRDDRRAYNNGYRDGRHDDRWDNRRHNGYYRQGRWYYGPPPSQYHDVQYGYHAWRRGDRLPAYYRSHYRPVDWRYYRLREPPRGYHYVYDNDREEYLLVGIATGVILGVILSN
jgi:Ni/Co efflux regulator RcnB